MPIPFFIRPMSRSFIVASIAASACRSAASDRTCTGNDSCRVIGQLDQLLRCIHDPAQPPTGRIVEDGVASDRNNVARDEDVLIAEKDVDVAIRVRLEQVAVFDLLVSEHQLACLVERLRRQRGSRTRFVPTVLPVDVEIRTEPELRVLVRDDLRAGLREFLVRAGVIPVPVRVEQRVDAALVGQLVHDFHQLCRAFRRAAIHEQHAFRTGERDDVAARAADEREAIAQRGVVMASAFDRANARSAARGQ